MSQPFVNVHIFDGKLNSIFTPTQEYTIQEKTEKFTNLMSLLSNPDAVRAVQHIINDLPSHKGGNFQQENNLDASDILIHLLHLKENPDVINGLNEQLADTIKLGICPSGRCTRLLQLWVAFK